MSDRTDSQKTLAEAKGLRVKEARAANFIVITTTIIITTTITITIVTIVTIVTTVTTMNMIDMIIIIIIIIIQARRAAEDGMNYSGALDTVVATHQFHH